MNRLSVWVGVAVVAAVSVFVFFGSQAAADKINLTITYAAVMVILLFALLILVEIANGKIDISAVLTEAGGGASMSRFQLLIFTLIIALCFVLIVVHTNRFPAIPREVLELLGVSATTYAVSKGIQASGMPPKPPSKTPDEAASDSDREKGG